MLEKNIEQHINSLYMNMNKPGSTLYNEQAFINFSIYLNGFNAKEYEKKAAKNIIEVGQLVKYCQQQLELGNMEVVNNTFIFTPSAKHRIDEMVQDNINNKMSIHTSEVAKEFKEKLTPLNEKAEKVIEGLTLNDINNNLKLDLKDNKNLFKDVEFVNKMEEHLITSVPLTDEEKEFNTLLKNYYDYNKDNISKTKEQNLAIFIDNEKQFFLDNDTKDLVLFDFEGIPVSHRNNFYNGYAVMNTVLDKYNKDLKDNKTGVIDNFETVYKTYINSPEIKNSLDDLRGTMPEQKDIFNKKLAEFKKQEKILLDLNINKTNELLNIDNENKKIFEEYKKENPNTLLKQSEYDKKDETLQKLVNNIENNGYLKNITNAEHTLETNYNEHIKALDTIDRNLVEIEDIKNQEKDKIQNHIDSLKKENEESKAEFQKQIGGLMSWINPFTLIQKMIMLPAAAATHIENNFKNDFKRLQGPDGGLMKWAQRLHNKKNIKELLEERQKDTNTMSREEKVKHEIKIKKLEAIQKNISKNNVNQDIKYKKQENELLNKKYLSKNKLSEIEDLIKNPKNIDNIKEKLTKLSQNLTNNKKEELGTKLNNITKIVSEKELIFKTVKQEINNNQREKMNNKFEYKQKFNGMNI